MPSLTGAPDVSALTPAASVEAGRFSLQKCMHFDCQSSAEMACAVAHSIGARLEKCVLRRHLWPRGWELVAAYLLL